MNFGYSEAKIFVGKDSVLKMTHQAQSQAKYLQTLGDKICPRVYEMSSNYYIMEKLRQPTPLELFKTDMVIRVHKLLREQVHIHTVNYATEWYDNLYKFLNNYQQWEAAVLLQDFYQDHNLLEYQLIHGDPTLANVMFRNEKIVLIDVLEPKGKIPSLKEMDYGKLIQSALGWESVQQKINYRFGHLLEAVISEIPENLRSRSWFWAGVNLLRLLPRSAGRTDIKEWVNIKMKECWGNACKL